MHGHSLLGDGRIGTAAGTGAALPRRSMAWPAVYPSVPLRPATSSLVPDDSGLIVYVIVYQPEKDDPEVFGPFDGPETATASLRRLAADARVSMVDDHSGPLATIDVYLDGERHRYQLVKIGSVLQLEAHGHVFRQVAESEDFPATGKNILSGY
ncbi:hypothetical protein BH23ACT5_BH23ACT5_07870 [soil metagenome]